MEILFNKMKKQVVMMGVFVLGVVLLSAGVLAKDYELLCLGRGEIIEFSGCHPLMRDVSCFADRCTYCVYTGSKGSYCPANINKCNARGLGCGTSSGGGEIDRTPPNISTCSSPVNGEIYSSRRKNIIASADKTSDWYYMDMNDRRPKWKRICRKKISCSKRVSFDEGFNEIKIKAVDGLGNSAEKEISFTVDSKKPKIYKTYPKRGFANGIFEVEFKEANPSELILYYGNKSEDVDVSSCRKKKTKTYCEVEVDVSEFDGQRIPYWFELKDIAGSVYKSKMIRLSVDMTAPVVVNLVDDSGNESVPGFWKQGEDKYNKYIYFNIAIDERNFDEVVYTYNSRGRFKEKRLCSRLKGGFCVKKVSFKKGHHIINVQVIDEAGNAVGERVEFTVV